MMKSQIGLGVLSIPSAFDTLGLVPGVICLLAVAVITTWSDYMVGVFKLKHREVYSIDDAGGLMFGPIGREVFGFVFCLCESILHSHGRIPLTILIDWIFVAGSGMLGLSIALNSVSTHATCTAVFVAVSAIAGIGFASIRTLGRISWLAWVGLVAIITASKTPVNPEMELKGVRRKRKLS
jgi:amino acid permease